MSSRLGHDARGMVMVEFLCALMPLLLLFLCMLELSRFSIAQLMMQRSAGIAARACAVIKDQPEHCDLNADSNGQNTQGQDEQVRMAATQALRPIGERELRLDAAATTCVTHGRNGTDDMTVVARFRCVVPLARDIVCSDSEPSGSPMGEGERTRVMTANARFAHQGADYDCWYSSGFQFGVPNAAWEPPSALEMSP